MDIDAWTKLLTAVGALVAALAWPLVAVFVLLRFGPALGAFFSRLSEISLKTGGIEAVLKNNIAATLAAAEVARPEGGATPQSTVDRLRDAATTVDQTVNAKAVRRAAGATVLWVDDRPDNNELERRSLQALGIRFVLARSTEEALEQTARQSFDVIISDMSRPPDRRAGYTLLRQLRERGVATPFIIYAGSAAQAQKDEARAAGALGSTNRASELFTLVLSALDR